MRRRRYLGLTGMAGAAGLTGCAQLPLIGNPSPPLRGMHERGRPIASLAVGPDGAYAAERPTGGETQLFALSLDSAATRWERTLLASGRDFEMWRRGAQLLAMNGQTLIVTEAGFSEQTWRRNGATRPVVTNDTVFLRSVRDVPYVEALDLATGGIVWSVQIGSDFAIPPTQAPRAIAGDRIVISDTDRPLRARDRSDGSLLWTTDSAYMIPVVGTETAIYAISGPRSDGVAIHRISPADGTRKTTSTYTVPRLRLAITEESVIGLVQTAETRTVLGLDPTTLGQRWRVQGFKTRGNWMTNRAIFGVDDSGRLREIDPKTGNSRWRVDLETGTLHDIAVTGNVAGVATPGSVSTVSRQDGSRLWSDDVPTADAGAPQPALTARSDAFVHAVGSTVRIYAPEN